MFASRGIPALAAAFVMSLMVAGCGDTWRGAKQDTGENLEATGNAIEEAGEDVQN